MEYRFFWPVIASAALALAGCAPSQLAAPPTVTPAPSSTPTPQPTETPQPTATATPQPTATATPVPTVAPSPTPATASINGRVYDAYIPAASKPQQEYQYTCEFDAAWVILHTYGRDVSVRQLIDAIPHDTSIEPSYEETPDGFVIRGGDIRTAFSGDYTANFLARTTGSAMIPVFGAFGLEATPVADRAGVEAALRRGALVWMKTTVDFKPWRPARWIMPDGSSISTVLGNDHAVVAMGFSDDGVVIRDVLGPTSSNWERPLEYTVPWEQFLAAWGAQNYDGLAVEPR